VENLRLDNVNIKGNDNVGGIAGILTGNSSVVNIYSNGTIRGSGNFVGGVAGSVSNNSSIDNSYSTGVVSGNSSVGGMAGHITNSAALNPHVSGSSPANRVVGSFGTGTTNTLLGNVAFSGMTNRDNTTTWASIGAANHGGADITAASVRTDGTIGGRFTSANGWTTQNGSLPGIGDPVAIPPHLQTTD